MWGFGRGGAAARSSGVGRFCGRAAGGSGRGAGFAAAGAGVELGFFVDDVDFLEEDDFFLEDDEELLFFSAARAVSGSGAPGSACGASSASISQGMGVIECLLLERRRGAGG